jgi:hypothetical protein
MRNIFLNAGSSAQAAHVAEELKPWLDSFTSWERMSTSFNELLRACYKVRNRHAAAHPDLNFPSAAPAAAPAPQRPVSNRSRE